MSSCSNFVDTKINMVNDKNESSLKPHRPFHVNDLSSIKQDRDYIDFEIAQSKGSGQYVLTDLNDNQRKNLIESATENPRINFKDGMGFDQRNIDVDSKVSFSKVKSEKKHQKQLFERPFKSMPYLGRGYHSVDDESFLNSPEITRQSKNCSAMAGVFIENQYTPLIPTLSEHVQNTYHLIPEDNNKKWLRGGIPTRDIVKDIDYFSRCHNDSYVKDTLAKRKLYLHK